MVKKGSKQTPEAREKIRLSLLGNKRNLGNKASEATRLKLSLARRNEKHNLWKGNKVKYAGLHAWVRRHLPKPELCQFCNVRKSQHLANITDNYKREFYNWRYFCVSCHHRYDRMKRTAE